MRRPFRKQNRDRHDPRKSPTYAVRKPRSTSRRLHLASRAQRESALHHHVYASWAVDLRRYEGQSHLARQLRLEIDPDKALSEPLISRILRIKHAGKESSHSLVKIF